MKLRNMTGIYLSCSGRMLLLYREGGRVVSDQWVASAGGHFEKEELNDPKACVLRELNEELTKKGYIVIAGKIPKKFLEEKYYGFAG